MVKDKLVTIAINSRKFEEPKGKISYNRVVELAYPDFAQFPDATYSIVYERGASGHAQGTLSKGGSVEIERDALPCQTHWRIMTT